MVEEVIERSGTPYFCFKDIDENKPTGSIKIRVETIGYFLKRYREDLIAGKGKEKSIEERLAEYERQLRAQLLRQPLGTPGQERLIRDAFDTGSMPTIHVGLEQLAASNPAHRDMPQPVAGD